MEDVHPCVSVCLRTLAAWRRHGATSFRGFPNEGTDEVIRDISHITRPHLNKGMASKSSYMRERTVRKAGPLEPESSELPVFPLDANAQLQLVFQYYCKFGRTGGKGESEDSIDNVNFSKFARECPGLLDSFLDRTEIDLIFTKCKSKGARRLTYSQFLDALSAMAAAKYRDEDPATAFSMLLAHHVFHAPPALGVQAAMARRKHVQEGARQAGQGAGGGMYASRPGPGATDLGAFAGAGGGKEEEARSAAAGGFAYGESPAAARGEPYGAAAGGGGGMGDARGGFRGGAGLGASVASYGGDPAQAAFDGSATQESVRGTGATLGSSPTLHDPPVPASARRRAQTRKELIFSPGRSARRDMARAERAQQADRMAASGRRGGYGHGVPPPPLPHGALGGGRVVAPGVTRHTDPGVVAFEADRAATSRAVGRRGVPSHGGPSYGSPAASRSYAGHSTAGSMAVGGGGGPQLPVGGVSAVPTAAAVPMGAPRGLRMTSGASHGGDGGAPGLGYGPRGAGGMGGEGSGGYYGDMDAAAEGSAARGVPGQRLGSHPLAGPLAADIHGAPRPVPMTKQGLYPAISRGQSFRDAPVPRRYDPSAQIAQARRRGQAGRAAMAQSARGRAHAKLGSPYYTPTLAGEANKPRSVWERLSQPGSFTGVYRRAYFTDGRMNAFSDTGASAIPTEFRGDTNTQSNETVHDISVMLRPNLKTGKTFR